MSLNNVNVIFCSWLLPRVAPGPGSSPLYAGAVGWVPLPALGCAPSVRSCPCWGHLSSQHIPPCRAALLSPFPTRPGSGCGWPRSSFSRRICRLHHLDMNQLCDIADIYWDVHLCPVSRFRCCICALGCSCVRIPLILVLLSYVS